MLLVSGNSDILTGGSGSDSLVSYSGTNTLVAGSGSNTLIADSDGNTLVAGTGSDLLVLYGANEAITAGTGETTINNGAGGQTTSSNELTFAPGISTDQLWFVQSGNDLRIDVMGTQNEVTISNWFGSVGNNLSEIATSDGSEIDSQVSQLVQAMATFQTNNPGFDPTASSNGVVPNDPTLQAALAAAWHH